MPHDMEIAPSENDLKVYRLICVELVLVHKGFNTLNSIPQNKLVSYKHISNLKCNLQKPHTTSPLISGG